MNLMLLLIGIGASYLIGSLSSAILVCKAMGKPDPRSHGSHNPGATNVLRVAGKVPAALVLFLDVAKGWLPVVIIQRLDSDPWLISAVCFAAVMGHLFPIFFKFKGGKGVATYLGVILGLSPLLGGIFMATWLGIFALCRISSLSAIIAIISMPIWAWFGLEKPYAITLGVLGVIIIWRHRQNISRLIHGEEGRIKPQ